jgi:ABC-2 type transport system permease protein
MRGFWKLTWIEAKLFFRIPIMAFFTLAFPLMILFIFGGIYGNAPSQMFGGLGSVDVSIPAYTGMIIGTSALLSLTITLANYRERGILRRYRATPVSPSAVLGAQLVVLFAMTLVGMGLLVLAGKVFYGMRFEGNVWSVLAGFTLGCLSFFAFGLVLAGLMPNVRVANVVGLALLYPMIFLSGATIPIEIMPPAIRTISRVLPMTYVVTLLQGLWKGDPWSHHGTEVIVLVAMFIVSGIIAVKVFRWE